jgi:16S rRNA (guanine(527)-N(7))-methyltransferase RsmG
VPIPDWFSQLLRDYLADSQIDQLYRHYELLLRWNQRMNLTTVKPGPEMVLRHYCESLFFAAHLPAQKSDISVLDLGSGAGFPGVPMAVLKPLWQVQLVESNQRKAVFLRESTRHLPNISVEGERIETIRDPVNWLVSRALDTRFVLQTAIRLSSNIGLMVSDDDFSSLSDDFGIAWAEPIRLPWGDRRLCVYGSTCNRST